MPEHDPQHLRDVENIEATHHLTTSRSSSRHKLHMQRYSPSLRIRRLLPHELVDCQLDRLLRRHSDELRGDTSVEASDAALIRIDLSDAIDGVPVKHFADDRGSLIL